MCRRHFGSFTEACRQAGLVTKSKSKPRMSACSVDGCCRPVRTVHAAFCEAHYMRMRRHGTTDTVLSRKSEIGHTGGYRLIYKPEHVLSDKNGYCYKHRYIFYSVHGDGPFVCHICGGVVGWSNMHVDHLNDIPDDNRIENLVAACATCNQWRGRPKMVATHRAKARLLNIDGVERTVREWSEIYKVPRTTIQRRLADGWEPTRAVTTPSGPTGVKRGFPRTHQRIDC